MRRLQSAAWRRSDLGDSAYAGTVRVLYLHGFGSGPLSTKGTAFARHFGERGIAVDRLNLRVPEPERLRLSAMIEVARAAIDDRAIVIGSSLGGLTAARLAERDPRVVACILLAPAFQLVARWRDQLGPDEWAEWQRTGWRTVLDHTTGQPSRIDFGFTEDVDAIDIGYPDVRVPTLVMHGRNDDTVPIDRARVFAAGRPNVQLIELDDDHQLIASLPRMLVEAEAFLGTVHSWSTSDA